MDCSILLFCLLMLLTNIAPIDAYRTCTTKKYLQPRNIRCWMGQNDENLSEESNSVDQKEEIRRAMANARKNAASNSSPGAGLATADEQSDAAYADLINTSMDQRGLEELSDEEVELLESGGRMWEKGAKTQKRKFGVFGDIMGALKAVAGGAQIEKNEYGET